MTIDWTGALVEQLDWQWRTHGRPRLEGLTDQEYLWEPVPGCWSIRPRGTSTAPLAAGRGSFTIDFAMPEPQPPPFTTIAWRMGHITVGVLGSRVASHFGGPPVDYESHVYAGTAQQALDQLDEQYAAWRSGVSALDPSGLEQTCGPAEGPFADAPIAALVLHINREVLHHMAEIACLRDLYAHTPPERRSG